MTPQDLQQHPSLCLCWGQRKSQISTVSESINSSGKWLLNKEICAEFQFLPQIQRRLSLSRSDKTAVGINWMAYPRMNCTEEAYDSPIICNGFTKKNMKGFLKNTWRWALLFLMNVEELKDPPYIVSSTQGTISGRYSVNVEVNWSMSGKIIFHWSTQYMVDWKHTDKSATGLLTHI